MIKLRLDGRAGLPRETGDAYPVRNLCVASNFVLAPIAMPVAL